MCDHIARQAACHTGLVSHRVDRVPEHSPHPELVRRLLEPTAYPHPTGAIRLIETHISWVFLTGPFVYKVKKPCNLGFLDFSTLERRRGFCHDEVRLSGRFAPSLYLGAVPITGTPGAPRVGGPGTPFEWAVKLVQFDEADRLDNRFAAGRLTAVDCDLLGAEIARVQDTLAVAAADTGWGTARSVFAAASLNLGQLRGLRPDAAARVDAITGWLDGRLAGVATMIDRRIAAGRVRECHGDLHLANIVYHDGRMMAFDSIEFSPDLRWIDVANDVAFLGMDLRARGRPDLAARVESAWMEAADDHEAAAVLPIYEVYRAVVRADVAAIRGGAAVASGEADAARADTDRHLDIAMRLMTPPRPVLYATSGLSGSGKTTLAAALVSATDGVRLRSDVERKRLAGMAATERLAAGAAIDALYDTATTRRVYERLAALARTLLTAGRSVVVDAAALARWQRETLVAAARAAGVPVVWLELDVPEAEAAARVDGRDGDASDATADVVRAQAAAREPITAAELATYSTAGGPARLERIGPGDGLDAASCRHG